MATVKFSDEMPKPTSIKGTDRFLISDGVTGEAKAPDFNQAKEYLNITGIELEPLVGGDSSATALVVANGPAGEQRTAEVSSGKWYDFGSGPVEASADRRWKSYWNGTSWVLKDMGELPDNSAQAKPWSAGTYTENTIVSHDGQEWISLHETNQEPSSLSSDWKVFGESENKYVGNTPLDTAVAFVIDGNDDVVAEFDKEGDIRSATFPVGIKPELDVMAAAVEDVKKSIGAEPLPIIETLLDGNGDVMRETDRDGGVHIPGLELTVQEEIAKLKEGGVKSYDNSSKIDVSQYNRLTPESSSVLTRRLLNGLTNFAVPHGVLPQDWNFPIAEIPTLSAPLATSYVPIKMMNGSSLNLDSGVVHPNVFAFDFPVNGYRYWMTINGYPDEKWEITWLYGTNNENLTGWELISEVPQPFEDNPILVPPYLSSHDSDSFIAYDVLRGEIIIAWRRTMRWHTTDADKQTNEYRYRSSNNGKTWSDVKQLIDPVTSNLDLMQSAGVIYNPVDNLYYYFDVYNTLSPGWRIKVRTNRDIQDPNGWGDPTFIATPAGIIPWHLEVKWIGKSVIILLHENQMNSPGNDKLWFCASNDMVNWTWSSSDLFGGSTPLYKSSFIPIYNSDGTMKFRIAYTTDERAGTGDQWKLKITDTNNFNIQ
ncbi:hypothetical protein [Sphingobacterium mizutaii]|uniref:hypothetical protein n=1 Tax=Sphingobacterium mizutaii TaxID=1010 RepID=UPI0016280405|nr:hypothetical protein [Sphingobacterium mizutaii]